MERLILVGGDSLRLDATALPARALRSLESDAGALTTLRLASQPLAPLTCARLAALTAPANHQQALAAALARQPASSPEEPPPSRSRAITGSRLSPARHDLRRAFSMSAREASPTPAPTAGRRTGRAGRAEREAGARVAEAGRGAPRAVEPEPQRQGLDWAVARVPGGAEASHTQMPPTRQLQSDDQTLHERVRAPWEQAGQPSAVAPRRPDAPAEAAGSPTGVGPLRGPAERTGATEGPGFSGARRPVSLEPERARPVRARPMREAGTPAPVPGPPEPSHTPPEPSHTPPEPALQPAGQLGALLRSWDGHSPREPDASTPLESPRSGLATRSHATDSGTPVASRAPAEDDLAAFGDTLGRVLVAELQRYGIEVDEG